MWVEGAQKWLDAKKVLQDSESVVKTQKELLTCLQDAISEYFDNEKAMLEIGQAIRLLQGTIDVSMTFKSILEAQISEAFDTLNLDYYEKCRFNANNNTPNRGEHKWVLGSCPMTVDYGIFGPAVQDTSKKIVDLCLQVCSGAKQLCSGLGTDIPYKTTVEMCSFLLRSVIDSCIHSEQQQKQPELLKSPKKPQSANEEDLHFVHYLFLDDPVGGAGALYNHPEPPNPKTHPKKPIYRIPCEPHLNHLVLFAKFIGEFIKQHPHASLKAYFTTIVENEFEPSMEKAIFEQISFAFKSSYFDINCLSQVMLIFEKIHGLQDAMPFRIDFYIHLLQQKLFPQITDRCRTSITESISKKADLLKNKANVFECFAWNVAEKVSELYASDIIDYKRELKELLALRGDRSLQFTELIGSDRDVALLQDTIIAIDALKNMKLACKHLEQFKSDLIVAIRDRCLIALRLEPLCRSFYFLDVAFREGHYYENTSGSSADAFVGRFCSSMAAFASCIDHAQSLFIWEGFEGTLEQLYIDNLRLAMRASSSKTSFSPSGLNRLEAGIEALERLCALVIPDKLINSKQQEGADKTLNGIVFGKARAYYTYLRTGDFQGMCDAFPKQQFTGEQWQTLLDAIPKAIYDADASATEQEEHRLQENSRVRLQYLIQESRQ